MSQVKVVKVVKVVKEVNWVKEVSKMYSKMYGKCMVT